MVLNHLDLMVVAARLEGFEETIILRLIDRAQFSADIGIYQPGNSGFSGEPLKSLFSIRLLHQETMDSCFGRFCAPEERPFNKDLPEPRRKVVLPDTGLHIQDFQKINLTAKILQDYLNLVPRICPAGDDGQWGSSVELDVYALQAIARRIHYGALYVAESKFRRDPEVYSRLIKEGNPSAILEKLTRKDVEDRIVSRVREKTVSIQTAVNPIIRKVIDPDIVVDFYRNSIIPITKEGEVLYLLNRREDY